MKKFQYTWIVALSFVLGGCSNILDLESLTEPTNEEFFSNEQELQLALTGVYNSLIWIDGNRMPGQIMMDNGATDLAVSRGVNTGGFQELGAGSHSASTPQFATNYQHFYRGVGRANNLLQNMERAVDQVDENTYNQIRGEALTLRAYFYHYLIELYGDVPLSLTLATQPSEALLPRTPKADIVDKLLVDLQEASGYLPVTHASRGRITRGTALLLRSRIALYDGRYDEAMSSAQAVMNLESEAGYALHGNYEGLFQHSGQNSAEIMLVLPFMDGFETQRFPNLMGSRNLGGFGQIVPSQQLVDSYEATDGKPIDESLVYDPTKPFENRDPRLNASIVLPQTVWAGIIFESHPDSATYRLANGAVGGTNNDSRSVIWAATFSGYYWKKYNDENAQRERRDWSDQNFILFRYAEALLNYAEASIESNNITQSTLDAINRIRARAYGKSLEQTAEYPAITTTDSEELRRIIRRERKVEFANEGFRLFDIRRWKIAEKVMPVTIYGRLVDAENVPRAPEIDADGLVSYVGIEQYYELNTDNRFPNAQNRRFNSPRDYLLPIPQDEINTYRSSGAELPQNIGGY